MGVTLVPNCTCMPKLKFGHFVVYEQYHGGKQYYPPSTQLPYLTEQLSFCLGIVCTLTLYRVAQKIGTIFVCLNFTKY